MQFLLTFALIMLKFMTARVNGITPYRLMHWPRLQDGAPVKRKEVLALKKLVVRDVDSVRVTAAALYPIWMCMPY